MTQQSFSARLTQARVANGLSQADLAARVGIAPAQISRYESGRSAPRPHIAAKLAKALAVEGGWLAYGEHPPDGYVSETYGAIHFPGSPMSSKDNPLMATIARMESLVTQRERELRDAVRLIAPVILKAAEGLNADDPMPGDLHGHPVSYWRAAFEPASQGIDQTKLTPADQLSLAVTWTRIMLAANDIGAFLEENE